MRKIDVKDVRKTICKLCITANTELRRDILSGLRKAVKRESNKRAKRVLNEILENAQVAKNEKIPMCQDTGLVVVYCEIGQDLSIIGGDLTKSINDGVRDGYKRGYFRKSVVKTPLMRLNTGTNTPAVIYTKIVQGNRMRLVVLPKGFGSENKSSIKMFMPTATFEDIKKFVLEVVKRCGADACPPLILGIGMGGTFEKAAELAKLALINPIDKKNPNRHLEKFQRILLEEINNLGIGPMGLGGKTTALGVNILEFPTHIAGLPVAVCVSCHAMRVSEEVL